MNFLHLCAADHAGAGTAAWRMHDALRSLGHGSRMLVLDKRSKDAEVLTLGEPLRGFRMRRTAQKGWLKLSAYPDRYMQNQLLSPGLDMAAAAAALDFKPDVIVAHVLSHFLSPDDVLALQRATAAPVLWSLLDMALMTGGCHYAWGCTGYEKVCGSCPALRRRGPGDLSARVWAGKQRAMSQTRGWVVAGSSVLARQAAASSLLGQRRIETLLLSVSPTVFRPGDKAALRAELGVAGAERVIFFGAIRFDQRRKGMQPLLESLLLLADQWPTGTPLPAVLAAGNAEDFAPLRQRGYRLVELGFVNIATLAKAYGAADVFACPSLEDSGPMMINESMMAGTPVVAFRMGVVEDLVEDGISGVAAELGNVAAFAAGLREVLLWGADKAAQASARCRAVAIDKCSPDVQLQRLVAIAQAMLDREGAPSTC